jgi:DNA-binding transcriptional regulator LsrR (DeoR family)
MFVMVNKSLLQVIKQIGLTSKHGVVYGVLLQKPGATPLVLARETKLNRSSLYRYLEDLRERGLVELLLGDKSSRYGAKPDGLSQYLLGEEARVETLKTTIPRLTEELAKIGQNPVGSEVKYFQGVEGLKQMLWNAVSQKNEFVGLGYQDWNTSVGRVFADKLRAKMIENKLMSREILNVVDDSYKYTAIGETYTQVYAHRPIDPKILEIRHDTYIYGDVFAYYYHLQGEYFGVEIHNKEIARTERQMFEILWKMAEKS